jgi:hypothetical protein
MVGTVGSTALAPPRLPVVDVSYVDGGRSRISVSTSQGPRRRRFLALMVGAPRSPAPTPPRGATMSSTFLTKSFFRVCRYPTDRVPLHTSLKSRQIVGRASTHCHVPCGSGPHLPAEVGSSAAMCPMAPDHTSWLRWAPVLPGALWFQTSPPS